MQADNIVYFFLAFLKNVSFEPSDVISCATSHRRRYVAEAALLSWRLVQRLRYRPRGRNAIASPVGLRPRHHEYARMTLPGGGGARRTFLSGF